jgi:hypothetical protein
MRVALRRMRAALSDFKVIIPVAQVDWLKCESKWLISSLASARDWDVFLSVLLILSEFPIPAVVAEIGLVSTRRTMLRLRVGWLTHVLRQF